MPLPSDYLERVYAGVLGKIIGVYLGRPFEGWTHDRIMRELGEINYYVHDRLDKPLIVTDDDISGTFTFLRALPDHGNSRDITPEQIGQSWLNYIIERETILWWGGVGNSTEHTAYMRLKNGIPAPRSGSIELNGKTIAEQIGAQIFIDGWAMVAPNDPELAVELAGKAGSVSHDGEAVYGAQIIAALESLAFGERDLNMLLDEAVKFIPHDSVIYRAIHDIREWHATETDWRKTLSKIQERYGYDTYGGNCHMVPNHALIIFSLLYGDDDFQKSLMIVNTSGWDTDCNSGNVGCILGIKNGLKAFEGGPDWRGPVADRMYLPTAEGGRAITDAVTESVHIVNIGRSLAGEEPIVPKNGARFHFSLPGSVQGFQANGAELANLTCNDLEIKLDRTSSDPIQVFTPTFIPPDAVDMPGYGLISCPTLYSGQLIEASIKAHSSNVGAVKVGLFVSVYGEDDKLLDISGDKIDVEPGASADLNLRVPDTKGRPIARVGLEFEPGASSVTLDCLSWNGSPDVALGRPFDNSTLWRRAWVNAVDQHQTWASEAFKLSQNSGRGLFYQGTCEWRDYSVSSSIMLESTSIGGIAAYVQGLQRYYALVLSSDGNVQLIKRLYDDVILDKISYDWDYSKSYELTLGIEGNRILVWVEGNQVFDIVDDNPLTGGAAGFVLADGTLMSDEVRIRPV